MKPSLVAVLQELAPASLLHNPAALRSALAQFRQQNPAIMGQADSLAEAWCWMLARREWSSLIGLVTGEVLSEVVPSASAAGNKSDLIVQALKLLDRSDCRPVDVRAVESLIQGVRTVLQKPFPIRVFLDAKWKFPSTQCHFLSLFTQCTADLLPISQLCTPILTAEQLRSCPPSTQAVAMNWIEQPWNSQELVLLIMKLAESDVDDAKRLLDMASRQSTELILLGLIRAPGQWSQLHQDVVQKLITIFLVGHSSAVFVLTRVWATHPQLVHQVMVQVHRHDPSLLSRILDLAQELKGLPYLLDQSSFGFTIDLAGLAARREYLNLDKWLNESFSKHGDPFLRAVLEFLQTKLMQGRDGVPMSEDTLKIFLGVLNNWSTRVSAANLTAIRETQSLVFQVMPQLAPDAAAPEAAESTFPPEIEEEANSYYEKIYSGELAVSRLIEQLRGFKNSGKTKDQEVYACIIHNLFDEIRFFPKYPDKELVLTGELFGALIQHQLVSPVRLALGLRHVLDALRKPLGSKMFRFGITALLQFQQRLAEWPQYCHHILQIGSLQEAHPEIVAIIQQALAHPVESNSSALDPMANGISIQAPQNNSLTAIRADTLSRAQKETTQYDTPNEAARDKILFLLNNLSQSNLTEKVEELKVILVPTYYMWFAHVLVVQRASIEPNFHSLYLRLLETINDKQLWKIILVETVKNVRVLLSAEKTLTSSQERTLLKNLASWFGGMTLARDKPIRHKDVALKDLLIEGYQNNRLIVVIPFVCKILEQVKGCRVFRPPNPWLMGILCLLVELYQYAELKLNLKFEIEVMCKNTDIELKDIEPTNVLQIGQEEAPLDVMVPEMGAPPAGIGAPDSVNIPIMAGGTQLTPSIAIDESGAISFPNLPQFISFQSNAPLFNAHPALKKLVLMSIDRSLREIIGPVVERSISISTVATRELILKDFSTEPSEDRMRRSAQIMSSSLAGHLAMVTSKEPFRISMTAHLRTLLLQSGLAEPIVDALAAATVQDNIELGASIVEKAAMEKAVPDINDALAHAFLARQRQRERGLPWVEVPQFNNSRYPGILPDGLRLRPGAHQQLRVYEDFLRGSRSAAPVSNFMQPSVAARSPAPLGNVAYEAPSQIETPVNPLQQLMDKILTLLLDLDKLIQQNSDTTLSSLPATHEIISLVRQINVAASQFFVRDDLALWFGQKLVQLLFKNESPLGMEIYILLLERICELSKRVAREFTAWLLFSEDEKKYNINVTHALIQAGLLNVLELDTFLAKQLQVAPSESLFEFAIKLAEKCLCEEPPSLTFTELYHTLVMIAKLSASKSVPENLSGAVSRLHDKAAGVFSLLHLDEPYLIKKDFLVGLLEQWVQLLQTNADDSAIDAFIRLCHDKELLTSEFTFTCFVRHCTEASVESYLKLRFAPGGDLLSYQILDSLCGLLSRLIMEADGERRFDLLNKVLSVWVLIVVHAHEVRRELFDQKPYYRLFIGLLQDLESQREKFSQDIVAVAFSNAFHALRPSLVPGFIFAWLDLISHRLFMPRIINLSEGKEAHRLHNLLVDLLVFMRPFLRHAEMTDPIRVLYKGTLRVLLMLLHDFPEFMCDFHFSLCDAIPPSCIQLRNLILSAFPRNMRLPDPFTPNLKVDLLPEISQAPSIHSNFTEALEKAGLLKSLDVFLKTRGPASFLTELKDKMLLSTQDVFVFGTKYNVSLINSLVLYVGVHAVNNLKGKNSNSASPVTQSAPMDIYQRIATDLDSEGRYHFLNAIANQLRYPNSHTHYFSCVLLYLFAETNEESLREQITRVLLERLIVNRPHPWGLLITFIELLKNPRYNFWSHEFTRCAPDIERLFESVARSCMIPAGTSDNGSATHVTAP